MRSHLALRYRLPCCCKVYDLGDWSQTSLVRSQLHIYSDPLLSTLLKHLWQRLKDWRFSRSSLQILSSSAQLFSGLSRDVRSCSSPGSGWVTQGHSCPKAFLLLLSRLDLKIQQIEIHNGQKNIYISPHRSATYCQAISGGLSGIRASVPFGRKGNRAVVPNSQQNKCFTVAPDNHT